MMRIFAVLACSIRLTAATSAAEPTFAVKPGVTRTGDGATITFTASAATDVEVAVLDKDGKVVRHLAAGRLGDNAPAPLVKGSLKQTITWDGKDDLGRRAEGGSFRVRVGLGLRPELGGFLGDNPASLGSVRGLAAGPGGELFVFHVYGPLHPSDGSLACTVLDRDGQYLRTILPYPANLAGDRLKGLKRLKLEDGSQVPFLYQAETRSLLPGAGDLPPQQPVVSRDGRLAFVGVQEGPHRYAQPGLNQVVVIDTDGGIPDGGALRTVLAKSSRTAADLALSPDEKTIYATGLRDGDGSANAVYRFSWSDAGPQVFVAGDTGPDESRLNKPSGIAVDGEGQVYVADSGNNRVAVFRPDGRFRGALKVDRPERVAVHPRTGAVYVISGELKNQLLKFSSWEKPEPVAQLKLPSFKHEAYTALLALDALAQTPVLWVASPKGYYAKMDLLRIEDRGDGFAAPVDVGKRNKEARPTAGPVLGMDLDRQRGRLFVNDQLYDIKAGKWQRGIRESTGASNNSRGVGSVGLDGNFYSQIYPKVIRRIGPDLKKLPFPAAAATKGDLISPLEGSMRVRGRGITADPRGNVFVLLEDGRGQAYDHVYVFDADGKLKHEKLIDSSIRSVNSIRVDYAGNLYLALGLRPGKDLLPPGLEGQVPAGPKDPDAVNGVNCYPLIYGSIAKFSPKGGSIRPDVGGVACNYAWGTPIEVKGAEWIFSGASPVVSWRVAGTPDICNCESPRFDVDGYGRTFFSDAARFRVGVLDTGGNLIAWFGSYGNADSAGPGSKVPEPAIPLYWPYNVSVDDDHAYVGDRLNRRVVRVRLSHAATETLDIPTP